MWVAVIRGPGSRAVGKQGRDETVSAMLMLIGLGAPARRGTLGPSGSSDPLEDW